MDYANFSMGKLTNVKLSDCSCVHAAFDSLKLKGVALSGCKLMESEWLHTPLKGVDLRGNDLSRVSHRSPRICGARSSARIRR